MDETRPGELSKGAFAISLKLHRYAARRMESIELMLTNASSRLG
jgi:hypothetical protein